MRADEQAIERVIEAAYDGAMIPERWPQFLTALAALFNAHFADSFSRTVDYTAWRGVAVGLDRRDYQEEFLDTWVKRNVWGKRRPVRTAGEVLSTRQIMSKSELQRTDMYCEYLAPRDLDEGLRIAVRVEDGWVQDISLLRAWSAGPFETAEIALAGRLLPHLKRCALVANRFEAVSASARAAEAGIDALPQPLFLLDAAGRPVFWNRAADQLLDEQDGLALAPDGLRLDMPDPAAALSTALSRAIPRARQRHRSSTLMLSRPSGRSALQLIIVPVVQEETWAVARRAAVMVVVNDPERQLAPAGRQLGDLFGLTEAESAIAHSLATGLSLQQIAARSGRSPHTVRTLLARAMRKTRTGRQADLVRLVITLPTG